MKGIIEIELNLDKNLDTKKIEKAFIKFLEPTCKGIKSVLKKNGLKGATINYKII